MVTDAELELDQDQDEGAEPERPMDANEGWRSLVQSVRDRGGEVHTDRGAPPVISYDPDTGEEVAIDPETGEQIAGDPGVYYNNKPATIRITLPPDQLDADTLDQLARDFRDYTGQDSITAESIATDSVVMFANQTLPPGTMENLRPRQVDTSGAIVAAESRYNRDVTDLQRRWNSAAETAETEDDRQRIRREYESQYTNLTRNRDAIIQGYTRQEASSMQAQANAAWRADLERSIGHSLRSTGTAFSSAYFEGLVQDAMRRDPNAAMNFVEGFGDPRVTQAMLPVMMGSLLEPWGGQPRPPDSSRQQEYLNDNQRALLDWVSSDPQNAATMMQYLRDQWNTAQMVDVPRNPLGTPLNNRYYAQRNAFVQGVQQNAFQVYGLSVTNATDWQALTDAERQRMTRAYNAYNLTFGRVAPIAPPWMPPGRSGTETFTGAKPTGNLPRGPQDRTTEQFNALVSRIQNPATTPRYNYRPIRGL